MSAARPSFIVLCAVVMLLLSQQNANAAATDNIVPTSRYNHTCQNATQANPKYVCQTDNASTGWRAEAPIDTTTSANDTPAETSINTTMANSYNGTDLNTYFDTTPVYSGPGETDVVYRSKASDFGSTGYIGYTWCDDAAGLTGYDCDQQYVNFRYTNASRALACHETGHAVGLLHGSNSSPELSDTDSRLNCMVTPIDNNLKFLDDTNVENINSVY